MRDDELDLRLKSLPGAAGQDGFEAGVRRRLAEALGARRRRRRAGAALGLVAALAVLSTGWYHARTEARAAELAALLAEQRALRSELRGLRDLADTRERIILDDGAERVLYLDWRTVRAAEGSPTDI